MNTFGYNSAVLKVVVGTLLNIQVSVGQVCPQTDPNSDEGGHHSTSLHQQYSFIRDDRDANIFYTHRAFKVLEQFDPKSAHQTQGGSHYQVQVADVYATALAGLLD